MLQTHTHKNFYGYRVLPGLLKAIKESFAHVRIFWQLDHVTFLMVEITIWIKLDWNQAPIFLSTCVNFWAWVQSRIKRATNHILIDKLHLDLGVIYFNFMQTRLYIYIDQHFHIIIYTLYIITSPPEGVSRYCFHPVCLCVCLCVCVCICVSGQYFGILFLCY